MNHLFLDIENTIAENISVVSCIPNKVEKIKRYIKDQKPDSIETFSFGIWIKINQQLAKHIINFSGIKNVKIQHWLTNDLKLEFLRDIFGEVKPNELHDFIGLTTKEFMFEWYVKKHCCDGSFVLIDDTVSHFKSVEIGNQRIVFINIDKI